MKRPLAYITAHWGDCTEDNMKLAAKYCRSVYDAGYQPICPMMMHTLFLRDAIPRNTKTAWICPRTTSIALRCWSFVGISLMKP